MSFFTQGKPKHPLRDALRIFMGGKRPPDFVQGYEYSNLTDAQHAQLQDWVSLNLPATLYWSTAIGIIESAEKVVDEAVGNANIPPKDDPVMRDEDVEALRKKRKKQRGKKKRRV